MPPVKQNIEKPKNFKKTLKKTFKYLKEYKISLIIVVILTMLSTVFSIVGPKILGNATTEIFKGISSKLSGGTGVNFDNVFKILFTLGILYVVSAIFSYIQGIIMTNIAQKTSYKLRKEISPVATDEEILCDMISSLASKYIKPVEAAKAALGYVDDCLSDKDFGKDNSNSLLCSAMRSIISNNFEIQFTNDAKVNGSDVIVETDIKICVPDAEGPFIARKEYKTFENLIETSDVSDTTDQGPEYNGYTFCEAQKLSIKELFPSEEDTKVIVLVDGDGNYAADKEGMIYAANVIDGKSIDSVELVSSDWLNGEDAQYPEESVKEESEDANETNNTTEYYDDAADNAAIEDYDNQGVMKEVRGDMFNDEAKETPVENLTQDFCDNLRKEMMGGK